MFKKLILILLLPASFLLASGFSIYEQGNRSTGMAGAFIARANDPSAVFYNPAGLTNLSGWQIQVGTTMIQTQFAFTGPTSMDSRFYTRAQKGLFFPSHLYLSYALTPKLSLAFGFYSPFGLASEWGTNDNPWVGRLLATRTELKTFFYNPTVAYRLTDNFSLAVGASLVRSNVDLEKDIFFTPRNLFGHSKLTADATGFGFNVGLQYRLLRRVHVGLTYRSSVNLDFNNGTAAFTFPKTSNPIVNQEVAAYFPTSTKAKSKLTLPASIGLGLAYDFTENLSFELDYVYTGWHSFDQIKVRFDQPVAGQTESVNPRNYKDSYSLRFGLEYRLDKHLTMRAGYCWDYHAVPAAYVEPTLPENDRHNYTIGLGYRMNHLSLDIAYHILLQDDREVKGSVYDFDGIYTGIANILGLTLGFAF